MIWKWTKRAAIGTAAAAIVGGFLFGGELVSYVRSGANATRAVVRDNVPIEFELKRAQDLLEEIIPEIQQNIRMIAQEEVEVAALRADLKRSEESFGEEKQRIQALRTSLETAKATFTFAGRDYTREQLKQDLAWRFDRFKEAEIVLAAKQNVLNTREQALAEARQMLDRTRMQKQLLASKIEALESKHRLIKASSIGSGISIDNSKIAQTEKLIDNIKQRLDVAERVMAYESRFVQEIPVDGVQETELLQQIDAHFSGQKSQLEQPREVDVAASEVVAVN